MHDSLPLSTNRPAAWLAWTLLLLAAAIAYWPGLSGGFAFDDHVNLSALGATGPVADWPAFWRYVTSGTADPTGRPLALLSFLLDARDWPADPAPFLRTNLCLHLLNGSLLFVLLRQLGRLLPAGAARADAAAVIGAGLWLLHPLFVSTTLYIVQREAMLPATFILLGLIAYAKGRERFAASNGEQGLSLMILAIVLGTTLALLCKANGILLPLLAWVLEATVLRGGAPVPPDSAAHRRLVRAKLLLLGLPTLLVALYLGRYLFSLDLQPGLRTWTIGERLLTEPRVLLEYLGLLLAPRAISTGLYNDDYAISTGLLSPPETLAGIVVAVVLLGMGAFLRKRAPAWSAALLFFFAAHLLESTVVPLELYFEHRNYVPALLLFWPAALALAGSRWRPWLRHGVAAGALAVLALITWQRASLWGDPRQLSALGALRNPESSRSQAVAAIALLDQGRAAQARKLLDELWRAQPVDLQIALNYINAACATGGLARGDAARLEAALRGAPEGALLVAEWMERSIVVAADRTCPGIDLDVAEGWLAALHANPRLTGPRARARSAPTLRALLALMRKQPDRALANFDLALAANPDPQVAAGHVAWLASHGYYEQALRHLDHFERLPPAPPPPANGMAWVHHRVLAGQGYWQHEIEVLRGKLEAEIAARPAAGGNQP